MISKPVWFWLPGCIEPVQAGVFELLDEQKPSRGKFTYLPAYLQRTDRLPLDPFSLTLGERTVTEVKHGGIFGILRDSGPDSWGRAVLQKELGRELSEIENLELAPGDNVGAIAVGDPTRKSQWKPWKLADLNTAVDEWGRLQTAPHEIRRFLSPDTGLGGAKPKTTIEHDKKLWLAKFPERGDSMWLPYFENAALRLAKECDINSCDTEVKVLAQDKPILLVQRFDRVATAAGGWTRKGYASADTVMQLGDKGIGEEKRTYVSFGWELRRWCTRTGVDAKDQVKELWRRIVFNGMVGNADDHAKNHGLIQEGRHWKLAPAFDVVPYPKGDRFALALPFYIDKGVRTSSVEYDNLILAAAEFGYSREEAVRTMAKMAEIVMDKWHENLQDIPASEREYISHAFSLAKILGHAAKQEIQTGILPDRRHLKRSSSGIGR